MRCPQERVTPDIETLFQIPKHIIRKVEASSVDGAKWRPESPATDLDRANGVIFAAGGVGVLIGEALKGGVAALVGNADCGLLDSSHVGGSHASRSASAIHLFCVRIAEDVL